MVIEKPCRIFCCYARDDQKFLLELKTHLKSLQRDGLIDVKSDMDISPGSEWERDINNHLQDADIILLLVSPDFIASDYCYDKEMGQAIARHEQGTARVIPVILRPANWYNTPFGKLQALPKDAAPISIATDRDTAFNSVTKGIRAVVQDLTTSTPVNGRTAEPSIPLTGEDSQHSSNQERKYMDNSDDREKQTARSSTFGNINFGSSSNGSVIGGDSITTNNTYYTNQKDGIQSLKKGSQALLNRDYSSAKNALRTAVQEIDEEQHPGEAARANYLFALALLNGKLPRSQGGAVIEAIENSMKNAIKLNPSCASYYRIFACIERDVFEHNGLSYRLNEVHDLERGGYSLPPSTDDNENEDYFRRCQPNLKF